MDMSLGSFVGGLITGIIIGQLGTVLVLGLCMASRRGEDLAAEYERSSMGRRSAKN